MRALLQDGPYILEAPMMVAIGFVIFRGGLQVLKVSLAGRVCTEAQPVEEMPRRMGARAGGVSPRRNPSDAETLRASRVRA
jgi:hypothetical protein